MTEWDGTSTVRFGSYELNRRTGELRKGGMRIRLQQQPVRVLNVLLSRPGDLITRDELRQALWPSDTFVDFEHGLSAAVNKLRQALNDDPEKPRYIETLPKLGYRFIGTIASNGNGYAGNAAVAEPKGAAAEELAPPRQNVAEPATTVVRGKSKKWLWVAAALIFIGATGWFLRPTAPLPRITNTLQLTSDGRQKFGPIATDGVRVYFSEAMGDHWGIAAVPVAGGETTEIHTPFPIATIAGITPDHLGLVIGDGELVQDHPLWIVPIVGGTPRRLADVIAHEASWSADGQRLAYVRGGDLFVAKADGTEPKQITRSLADPMVWAWSPVWSADGRRLRFERYQLIKHISELWEIDSDGGNLHAVMASADKLQMQCCGKWTPDGRYYVYQSWNGTESGMPWPAPDFWVVREKSSWRYKSGHEPLQLTAGPIHFFDDALSPDGKTIFTTSVFKRGELLRNDRKSEGLVPYLSGVSAECVTYSPDGGWIAYVKFPQGELWKSRVDGSEALKLTSRPLMTFAPSWSPDGKQIAFSGQEAGADWQIYVVSADGGPAHAIPETMVGDGPVWSHDGARLLFTRVDAKRGVKIQGVDLKQRRVYDFPGGDGKQGAIFSPDGRYVVAGGDKEGTLVRFDTKSGKWSTWIEVQGDAQWANWSRDGKAIYFLKFTEPGVYRAGVNEHTAVKVLDLGDFHFSGARGNFLSLTPEDEPILLREIAGGTEIYGLQWEAP